jgi:hypothetical protein
VRCDLGPARGGFQGGLALLEGTAAQVAADDDTFITLDANDRVILHGVSSSSLTASQFRFV